MTELEVSFALYYTIGLMLLLGLVNRILWSD